MDLIQFMPVAFFSVLAFWKQNAVLFILAGVMGLFTGFIFYDNYVTPYGLAIGLLFLCYSLSCFGWAFRMMIWSEREIEED